MIALPHLSLAQAAVLKGVRRFRAVEKVSKQVAFTSQTEPEISTFSVAWKVPRIIFELSAGRLALKIVSFLVADAGLFCENLRFEFPVLRHLGIDSRTLLERNRATIGGTTCSDIQQPKIAVPRGSLGQ